MTDFYGINEDDYQQIKTDTMTNTVAQCWINHYVDAQLMLREHQADEALEPLPAIDVYHIRQEAMNQFNAWLQAIKEQG
jgi:hypothetical protein